MTSHIEEIRHSFSSSNNQVIKYRQVRWEGHVACVGEKINSYRLLFVKTEGMRPRVRTTYKVEDDIKMDLQEIR